MSSTEAAATFPIPSLVSRLNPLVRRLLALGMPMGPNVLVTVRGRKTGTPYTFPAATLRVDGREFLFSSFGEVSWVQNLRASGELTIRRGRRDHPMIARELTPEVAAPVLEAALTPLTRVPVFGSMIAGWYGIDRSSSSADYLIAAHGHPGFELRPVG